MAEYIKRKSLVDLVLSKLKYIGDARIMNQNDEKVLSEIDGYEKAMKAVHELILDRDLIEDVQPVIHAHWRRGEEKGFRTYNPLWYCSNCGGQIRYDTRMRQYQKAKRPVWEVNAFCRKCGARMDGEENG